MGRDSMLESPFADARILVVDDEETNVHSLTRILRAAGYGNVLGTTDPRTVADLYRKQDPDVILLDLHMPNLDGLGVLQQLRAIAGPQAYVPVLVLTGDYSPEARRRALSEGAKDFLTKPFEVGEVLLRIRNLLETRYLHREITTQNQLLEQRVQERTGELEDAYLDTLERLASAAEFRDDETGRHTERVGEVAALLGGALDLPEEVRPRAPEILATFLETLQAQGRLSGGAAFVRALGPAYLARCKAGGGARTPPVRRGAPAIGRNDPCPCGSGKKFKKCCGQ